MDIGESALCGDTESLCCSSDLTPLPNTQGSCSDTGSLGGKTENKQTSKYKHATPVTLLLKGVLLLPSSVINKFYKVYIAERHMIKRN